VNDKIQELSNRAVELVQIRPNGTCEMSKYNQAFAQLIIDECCDTLETLDARMVPRPTWKIYERFGLDWSKDWYTDDYGIWRKHGKQEK
jgi:hypothetical protein